MYDLKRIEPDDGNGIVNAIMLTLVKPEPEKQLEDTEAQGPVVGWVLLLENFNFWYHTSTVTEILSKEENDERVKITFKTLNSTYEFRRLKS